VALNVIFAYVFRALWNELIFVFILDFSLRFSNNFEVDMVSGTAIEGEEAQEVGKNASNECLDELVPWVSHKIKDKVDGYTRKNSDN